MRQNLTGEMRNITKFELEKMKKTTWQTILDVRMMIK
jgi:hypothetical protein